MHPPKWLMTHGCDSIGFYLWSDWYVAAAADCNIKELEDGYLLPTPNTTSSGFKPTHMVLAGNSMVVETKTHFLFLIVSSFSTTATICLIMSDSITQCSVVAAWRTATSFQAQTLTAVAVRFCKHFFWESVLKLSTLSTLSVNTIIWRTLWQIAAQIILGSVAATKAKEGWHNYNRKEGRELYPYVTECLFPIRTICVGITQLLR